MTIVSTGTISFSDIRTEAGDTGSISMSQVYRGGNFFRKKATDGVGVTNGAASLPTAGAISFDDFYSVERALVKTYSADATNQDADDVFGSDYGVDYPKKIVIQSGVELGATSTAEEALEVPAGLSGTLTITNQGTLTGRGGGVAQAGGDAFEAAATCTFVNNGTVRAGGGGGGAGGTGGNGRVTNNSWQTYGSMYQDRRAFNGRNGNGIFVIEDVVRGYRGNSSTASWYVNYAGQQFRQGNLFSNYYDGEWGYNYKSWYIQRLTSSTTNYSGGSGGSGAGGAGYQQSAGTGSSGNSGGTNAGAGGTGGSGGAFGAAGSSGASGQNGNINNGAAGQAGGAAGKYLRGSGFVTFTNNGTVQGGTA